MLIVIIKLLFIVLVIMAAFLPVITWAERKQSAVMQDRIGANRADHQLVESVAVDVPGAAN